LSLSQSIGLLAHEVMHPALGHHWRMSNREAMRWNKAADYAINKSLIDAGLTLPDGALLDSAYDEKSAEEIYAMIPEDPSGGGGGGGGQGGPGENGASQSSDPGGCGEVLPAPKGEIEEAKADWKTAVAQATQMAKGNMPDRLKRLVGEVLDPPLPWFVLLRDFVERSARNDYCWTVPSRRYLSGGFVLPSLISEELPEVVVAIDTSGSIPQEDLDRFAAEASAVFGAYDTTVRVMYCDAEIAGEEIFTRADMPLKLNPCGGGGTDFRPVFDKIREEGHTPSCLIYFTDLYGRFPKLPPEYPVMWIATSSKTAPFGKTVDFRKD